MLFAGYAPQRQTTPRGIPARRPRNRPRAETAWAKFRNFAQSSSQCPAILPTLHCMRRAHHPPIAVAISSIANHSAFPALIILGELSAENRRERSSCIDK
jgi:hypothetical protein